MNPRFKVRIRQYENDSLKTFGSFLEIKNKINSVTKKERLQIDPARFFNSSNYKIPENIRQLNKKLNDEELSRIYFNLIDKIDLHHLKPIMKISYKRQAFENYDRSIRVTFDYNLKFSASLNKNDNNIYKKEPLEDRIILEIKYLKKMPDWLTLILKENDIKRQKFSKYCYSIKNSLLVENKSPQIEKNIFNNTGYKYNGNFREFILN